MPKEREEVQYWLALMRAPGIGAMRFRELLDYHGEPRTLFDNPDLCPMPRLNAYLHDPDWAAVEGDLDWLSREGCHLLTLRDSRYPSNLRHIPDAPPLIFLRGEPAALQQPQLAMVGSRNPTASGSETAHDFARILANTGITITSGLALGIDTASHRGALSARGTTIAVAGTGLDRVYPASNRDLAHAIIDAGGAIVSELLPGTLPHASNFPRRNRIISGLSLGTLVVEAAMHSGSLITARLAAEQGREVFAIPGSIHNPLARGCHQLIRQGAKLVESAADILEELAPQLQVMVEEDIDDVPASVASHGELLDMAHSDLLHAIGYEATTVNQMVDRSGLTAEAVSSMLLLLELQGFVEVTAGGYTRTAKRLVNETRRI